jgi:hypothetical protein
MASSVCKQTYIDMLKHPQVVCEMADRSSLLIGSKSALVKVSAIPYSFILFAISNPADTALTPSLPDPWQIWQIQRRVKDARLHKELIGFSISASQRASASSSNSKLLARAPGSTEL